ncbi:heterokaryon incompatibility protein-domain-containing protein [Hypomontagnella monticulosa]|nr:heterokaryon incompatibility protein-domain-containing protein [Hypomontagnella monticulosa]
MWLINTDSFELERWDNYEKESYAILSHTWEDEEVSFQDFRDLEYARKKKGFVKIERTVQMARCRNLNYAWVDTCCIDKTSSAELSEAINSMYRWYEDSAVCFAYLSDMPTQSNISERHPDDVLRQLEANFRASRWFTRGWTLQELVAPEQVEFYDTEWNLVGTKIELQDLIEDFTKIPSHIIKKSQLRNGLYSHPHNELIARRMSWAASRQTTRIEDTAYCLLGIFGINMPLLYGEGEKAFVRLQEEICKQTTDMSLFAWEAMPSSSSDDPLQEFRGLFAKHPSEFRGGHRIVTGHSPFETIAPYLGEISITNRGIRFDEMRLWVSPEHGILMDLGCCRNVDINGDIRNVSSHYICLAKLAEGFVRYKPSILIQSRSRKPDDGWKSFDLPRFHISKDLSPAEAFRARSRYNDVSFFKFDKYVKGIIAWPMDLWDPHRNAFVRHPDHQENIILVNVGDGIGHSESFIILIHTMLASTSLSVFSHQDREFTLLLPLIEKASISSPTNRVHEYLQYCDRKGLIDPFRKAAEGIGKRFLVAAISDDSFGPKASIQIHVVKRGPAKSTK